MDPVIPPVRSAQLPVLEPGVVDLIQMIDDGKTCNSIFRKLCSLNTDIPNIDADTNRVLLHSLPLPMLRSLLMGTLGPHFYSKDAQKQNWDEYVYHDYPGAYAAFIHIHHRQGAFLSQRETRQLIAALRKYSRGVSLYEEHYKHGTRGFPGGDREALEFTQIIDDQLRRVGHWDPSAHDRFDYLERPRFAESESRRIGVASVADSNINALITMFENRCTVDESDPADPDLDIHQLQSPIMIGDTGLICARVSHLVDDHGSGSSTSKVYALTMSCLGHLGFEAESVALPIFLTWEEDQIDPAEVLGTVLANSRLPGHGYNVKMPGTRGGRSPNPRLQAAKEHVFYWRPFLVKNIEDSLAEIREEAVADVRAAAVSALASANKEADELKCVLGEILGAPAALEETRRELREAVEDANAEMAEMQMAFAEFDEMFADGA